MGFGIGVEVDIVPIGNISLGLARFDKICPDRDKSLTEMPVLPEIVPIGIVDPVRDAGP
jgi:hypothetical protein